MAKQQKVIKYKKPLNFNIGFVIFLMVIIYVVFNVFSYFTSSPIAEYEVVQGTIATNSVYRGMILRDETVVYPNQDGYINYYVKNGARVSVNDVVYSIDTVGDIAGEINEVSKDGTRLEELELNNISENIYGFANSYDSNRFSEVMIFKNDLNSELTQMLNTNALEQLSEEINNAEANNTFYRNIAGDAGIVVYYTDGYEDVTADNFISEQFVASAYEKTNLGLNEQVTTKDAVYKLIGSEEWNVIIPISNEFAESLSERKTMKVRFHKDGFSTNASCAIIKRENTFYLNLSFETAMIRYINDRFVDIELVMNEETGLKIPKTAITSKEFFTIPKEYFTLGSDSDNLCLLIREKKDGEDMVTMVSPTIYYESETAYYIDDEYVDKDAIVVKPDSNKTYKVGNDVDELDGVYNINKGYAVFKQINVIYDNEEYAIIEPRTSYGVALYDHIALDGSKLKEDDLVTK